MFRLTLPALLAFASLAWAQGRVPAGVQVEEVVDGKGKTKILFIAGTSVYKPGEHDYIPDCVELMQSVRKNRDVVPVLALDWPAQGGILGGSGRGGFSFRRG